ncbi:hypothetical protein SPB21_32700 [Leptothoe sp. ISB3NOV94-8A]
MGHTDHHYHNNKTVELFNLQSLSVELIASLYKALAMGTIASGGVRVLNYDTISSLATSEMARLQVNKP